jgi:Rha family phage regulatory protein
MNLELTPIMVDGIEIYTNPEKTVSGMSISGLARLIGVDRATMSRINLQVLEEQYKNDNYALKVLSSGLFTPKLEAPNKAKSIKSEVCLLIIKYYAFGTSKVSNKIKNKCKELLKDNIKIKDFILQSYLQDEFKEIHEKAIKYEEMESLGLSKQVLCFKNNLVSLYEGNPVVDTLELATVFEKRHDIVLRDIHSKLSTSQNPKILDFYKKHIIKTFYYDTYSREQTKYLLTREGFSLIALGFTGEKAELFKIKYIEAFEEMYEKLRGYALAHFLGRTDQKQLVYIIKNALLSCTTYAIMLSTYYWNVIRHIQGWMSYKISCCPVCKRPIC